MVTKLAKFPAILFVHYDRKREKYHHEAQKSFVVGRSETEISTK